MVYSTDEFRQRYELLLKNAEHYIFTSTYRVFAECKEPIKETSPKLLDTSQDAEFLKTDEYALSKARQENILKESIYNNWTIIRPAITYSKMRFQLGTLEAGVIIPRAFYNLPVILPTEMLGKQATMTWGGDVAKMIASLILNPKAICEDFNTVTSEHQMWKDIADYYNEIIGLNIIQTNLDTYIKIVGNKYQVLYDRMFNRVMDNSKILNATGIEQNELTVLKNGLTKELLDFTSIIKKTEIWYKLNAKIDRILNTKTPLKNASVKQAATYYAFRFGIIK
jgi:hypothetical protein